MGVVNQSTEGVIKNIVCRRRLKTRRLKGQDERVLRFQSMSERLVEYFVVAGTEKTADPKFVSSNGMLL